MTQATVTESVLRQLADALAEMSARVEGKENALIVIVRVGSGEKLLVTTRGNLRQFASLDTAAGFLKDLGLARFDVDVSFHRPGRLRGARPDRAEALKQTRTKMYQAPLGLEL